MNGSANPIGPSRQPVASAPVRKWHVEILEVSRSLVGLPTLAVLACEIVWHDNHRMMGAVTAVALIVAVALRFLPSSRFLSKMHERQFLLTTLPWLLTAALALVSVLVVFPRRAKTQNDRLNESLDQLRLWVKDLNDAAAACPKVGARKSLLSLSKNKQDLQGLSMCLATRAAMVLKRRPGRADRTNDVAGLVSDVQAGRWMFEIDNLTDVLDKRLSVRPGFVGTGYSAPTGQSKYQDATAPEYLVPNLPDQTEDLWVWKLDRQTQLKDKGPRILESNVVDVLLNIPAINKDPGPAAFKQRWDALSKLLSENDQPRVLVRVAIFPESGYRQCLGRPDNTRVFMSNLADVKDLTVDEAVRRSGTRTDRPGSLFIWVYAPALMDKGQVVRATWGNVLDHFGEWITDERCKKAR